MSQARSALVVARVTAPGGATQVLPIPRTSEGEYQAIIPTTVSGVYPV